MFIGRKQELDFLNKQYENPKASLTILYGRRRVGKTETLKEFCKGKRAVFYSCQELTDDLQLKRFSNQMLQEDIPAKQYISEFHDWEQAFNSVLDLPFDKKLLIIDEFPYMCKDNSSIPSIIQSLWDTKLKNENVMIILCGSSMSFIEKELLSEKNPLYGRATGVYKMEAMSFYEAVQFFPDYSPYEKVLAYAVLGGIPHYLCQFENDKNITENIKDHILSKGTALYSEVEFLLHQELREISVYNAIIEAIALGNTSLNEISHKALIDQSSKTSIYIKNLMELGIIEREFSVDAGRKDLSNQSRGTYRLTDNYFRFWYTYLFTSKSELDLGDVDGVYNYIVKPTLNEYASYAFENICRQFVARMQIDGELPFRYERMGRWYGKLSVLDDGKKRTMETEIDLMALSRKSNEILMGECKCKESAFSFGEYMNLRKKGGALSEPAVIYYALFSTKGFDKKIQTLAEKESDILLYDLQDIVEYPINHR